MPDLMINIFSRYYAHTHICKPCWWAYLDEREILGDYPGKFYKIQGQCQTGKKLHRQWVCVKRF